MPKKNWTEEEKKAFGQKMKEMRAKKAAQKQTDPQKQNPEPAPLTVDTTALKAEALDVALAEIAELKAQMKALTADSFQEQRPEAKVTGGGETVGLMVKYPIEKTYYPDPTPQLIKEEFLKRFAFEDNFLVKWDVQALQYETKWGVSVVEPKFTCILYQKQFDEDGEPTDRLIRLSQLVFFEDPGTVRQLMVELDVDTTGKTEREIYDLIRYHRIKEWLKSFFLPPKNVQAAKRTTEEVIGGRVVVIEEASSVYDGI